jgi:hypothetical protein
MADKTFDEVRPDIEDDAAAGATIPTGSSTGAESSEGPSGRGTTETSVGGADSVPGTPDALPYTPVETDDDADHRTTHRDGSGDGLNET